MPIAKNSITTSHYFRSSEISLELLSQRLSRSCLTCLRRTICEAVCAYH